MGNSDETDVFENEDVANSLWDLTDVTLSAPDRTFTFSPWNPYMCPIAAGIYNNLWHVPARYGWSILLVNPNVHTICHLSNVVGTTGRVTAFIEGDLDERFMRLQKNRSNVFLASAPVNKDLEECERILGLSNRCKYAFLMGLHSRLGANSFVKLLASAPGADSTKLTQLIFSFVEYRALARVTSIIICSSNSVQNVVDTQKIALNYIDIVRKWKLSSHEQGVPSVPTSKIWVLMHLPVGSDTINVDKLVKGMKQEGDGNPTGLFPKELVGLKPFFDKCALLLLKYEKPQEEENEQVVSSDNVPEEKDGLNSIKVQPPADSSVPSVQFTSKETRPVVQTPKQQQSKKPTNLLNPLYPQMLQPQHQTHMKQWPEMVGPRFDTRGGLDKYCPPWEDGPPFNPPLTAPPPGLKEPRMENQRLMPKWRNHAMPAYVRNDTACWPEYESSMAQMRPENSMTQMRPQHVNPNLNLSHVGRSRPPASSSGTNTNRYQCIMMSL